MSDSKEFGKPTPMPIPMPRYKVSDLRRHIYFEKKDRIYIVAAYYELDDRRLVMAVKTHKHKSMAVQMAMRAAKERTLAGYFEEVKP